MKTYLYLLILLLFSCSDKDNNNSKINTQSNDVNQVEENFKVKPVKILGENDFWKSQDINYITLYCYYPESNLEICNQIIDNENNLHPSVIDSLTRDLSLESQKIIINTLITETDYQEDWTAECFEPHHGLIFKDKDNEIIGSISFCFECNQYKLKPKYVSYIPMHTLRAICEKENVPTNRIEISKLYNKK